MENIVREGEIACNKQFLLFSQCFPLHMVLIFHFKSTFSCRLQFVLIWTSPKFFRVVKRENYSKSLHLELKKTKLLFLLFVGIFGVPKQLCAEMYVKALIDFGIKDSNSMREVHFIDVNQDILDMIEKAHKDWVQNPDSISFDNALNYEDAPSYKGKKTVKHKGIVS